MRYYETIFIINPDLSDEDTQAAVEKFTGILTSADSVIVKTDLWGRRRLAYEVKKFSKGYYVLLEYGATPDAVAELERNFKIDEQIIRYLTVKKGDIFDAEAVAKAQAEAEAKAAQRAARALEEEERRRHDHDDDDDDDEDMDDDDFDHDDDDDDDEDEE